MTQERIIELLADHLDIDPAEINENTTFGDLEVDSLDAVEIMMELEDEFGIEIKASEAGKSVKELVEYVDARLN